MGPLDGHKDFEIDATWYEAKSISASAVQVKISSLEQLEAANDGHLVVMRIDECSVESDYAINLNKIVLNIVEKIDDPDDLNNFYSKLSCTGYVCNPEYENIGFLYKGMQFYRVDNMFPRMRRKDIPIQIGNVKYSILIDGINEFKEGE